MVKPALTRNLQAQKDLAYKIISKWIVLVNKKVASGMKPGTHGSTFGGNPLAMSVGNAVMDIMFKKGFLLLGT